LLEVVAIGRKNAGKDPDTNSVADPDPGSGAFLISESGIRDGKKIRIHDHPRLFSECYKIVVRVVLKLFDADPDTGSAIFLTLYPG
jgi:hypothetical protein